MAPLAAERYDELTAEGAHLHPARQLDSARDIGIAYKSVVYFKGVPIMGMPAMSFPLSSERD